MAHKTPFELLLVHELDLKYWLSVLFLEWTSVTVNLIVNSVNFMCL